MPELTLTEKWLQNESRNGYPSLTLPVTLGAAATFAFFGAISVAFFPLLILGSFYVKKFNDPFTSALIVIPTLIGVMTMVIASPAITLYLGSVSLYEALLSLGVASGLCYGAEFLGALIAAVLKFYVAPFVALYPLGFTVSLCIIVPLKAIVFYVSGLCAPVAPATEKSGLRVLITGDSFPPKIDGPRWIVENFTRGLQKEGHTVHCYTGATGAYETIPKEFGCGATKGPSIEVFPTHFVTLPSIEFVKCLIKFKPHVVHLHDITAGGIGNSFLCWLLGVPVVLGHHSRIDLYAVSTCTTEAALPLIMFLFPPIITALLSVWTKFLSGVLETEPTQLRQPWFKGHHNIRMWSSGCDSDAYNPKHKNAETRNLLSGGRPDLPLVTFVGRMSPEKQCGHMIDFVKLVNEEGKPEICRFAYLGNGPTWQEIKDAIGDRPDVYLPGGVYGKDLFKAYSSSDVLFTPTITGTLDQVVLEAQYSGIACVVPRAVAFPIAVKEGHTGALYDPLNMKDAKRALLKVLKNVDELKANARPYVSQNFTWEIVVDKAVGMYRHTILSNK